MRCLKPAKLKVGAEDNLFEVDKRSSRELAGEPRKKRIGGSNEDKVAWPVRFLKEQLAGSRRARNLCVRQEQPCAIPW